MKKQNKLKKGFTLIEVLIAVTIIGIMSSLTVLSYKNYIAVTNEAATKEELSQLAQVYELGVVNNEFAHSDDDIEYDDLKDAYEAITGYDMPFTEDEVSYSNKVLTLTKRDVTVTYDFTTKAMEVTE